ncbi:Mitotic arrest-deficient 1 [Carabus blaptoides fortunei]
MANTSNSDMSATMLNMMEVLHPRRTRRKSELRTPLDFMSPSKRRLSSESLDSPDKRPRIDSSLDVSWISSPRESRRMRAELIEARSVIIGLENRIHHMHGVRKELQVMFDNEIKSFQQQHERDRKTIDELETQMQSIRKREQDVKDELDELKAKVSTDKLNYENKIDELELAVSKLQSEFKEYESIEQDEMTKNKCRIEELEMVLNAAQKDAAAQKELAGELETRLFKYTALERDMEMKDQVLQKAQRKIKDLEYTLESYGEWQQQSKIQQQKLSSYPELEKEAQRLRDETKNLRDEVQNKLILEEQVYDLKTRMETFRNQEKKFATLQASHSHLENLVEEWRLLARGICDTAVTDAMIPKHVRQCIEKLQQQEISLTADKVQLESQLKSCQHDVKCVKLEQERSTKQLSDLQHLQQQHQALVHRLQKKLMLVSRERDSYRLQLDTYEKDLTVNIAPGGHGFAQSGTHKERIENLEKIVDGYRDMVNNLEGELKKHQPQLNAENVAPVRTEQLARMQEKIDRLQSENSRLTERCDELEIRLEQEIIGKDSVKGQVLHLRLNPLAESVTERETNVEKLQAEVDRLKRKIKSLEEGYETSKLSESVCSSREVQSLREQLKSSEIKMQRLKDVFKSSSHEFRNVCYMLLGYKIDRMSSTQYALSSMYAEAPDDCLQFQLNPDGNLNLLETPFSATLEDMVDLHLRHQSSIPVFLSALTMDLFNRTTMTN